MTIAARVSDASPISITIEAAAAAGELRQIAGGRASWLNSQSSAAVGSYKAYTDEGQISLPKATGIVLLDGGRAYWDHSAQQVTYKTVDDRDFFVGTVVGDAASGDTQCVVNLNRQPVYLIDLARDPYIDVPIGTLVLGGFGAKRRGGAINFKLDATNEAQKLDALSKDGFATTANAIVEFAFNIVSDGSGTVVDVSLGVASGTNATDADSITSQLFMHLDANATAIKLQSKDGTTTVAATDTTKTYTEGVGNANRVEIWFDMRNPADVQCYVNGVNVLPATVFGVSASATTWYALAHIEKTSSTDTYEFDLEFHRTRIAEQ